MDTRKEAIAKRNVVSLKSLFKDITSDEVTDLLLSLSLEDLAYLFSSSSKFQAEVDATLRTLPPLRIANAKQLDSLQMSSTQRGTAQDEEDLKKCFASAAITVPACFVAFRWGGKDGAANKICRDQIKDFTFKCAKVMQRYLKDK